MSCYRLFNLIWLCLDLSPNSNTEDSSFLFLWLARMVYVKQRIVQQTLSCHGINVCLLIIGSSQDLAYFYRYQFKTKQYQVIIKVKLTFRAPCFGNQIRREEKDCIVDENGRHSRLDRKCQISLKIYFRVFAVAKLKWLRTKLTSLVFYCFVSSNHAI